MLKMQVIGYLIYNFFVITIIYKGMNIVFDKDIIYSKRVEVLSYVIYYLVSISMYLLFGEPNIMILTNIIFIYLIQFNYKTKIKDKVLIAIYIYLIAFMLDLFFVIILSKLSVDKTINKIFQFNSTVYINILIQLIIFSIIIRTLKFFENMKFKINMPKTFWLPLIIVPFISIVLLLILVDILSFYPMKLLLVLLILAILNISVFLLYNHIVETLIKKEEKEILEIKYLNYIQQFEIVNRRFEDLNMLKHDVKKHFLYLNKLIKDRKYTESLKYVDELINKNNILKKNKKFIDTGNSCIDEIVNLKLNEALDNNIKIETDVLIPFDLDVSSVDMVCLLGNILDNSIEANVKLDENNRYIYFNMKYYNSQIFINIKNKYSEILKDKSGNIITSKKYREEKYGLGIKIIERTIEKYNGILKLDYETDEFNLKIVLNINN